jgi:sirohydrochlorin ferrochelatase
MRSPSLSGVVLLGHGSREPRTACELRTLADQLTAASPESRFEIAFLNQEPVLQTAVDTLVESGCTSIRILPLLVFVGKHILEDVPAEIQRLQEQYPHVRFEREPHLFRLPGFSALLTAVLKSPASQGN